MQKWRLIRSDPARGAWNMAVDEALMESVRGGGLPVLRFYGWAPACLSLGRNQPASGHYSAELAERWGVDVVRRLTGGRAVLHDDEITYAVIVGDRQLGAPREVYRMVNEALAAGLSRLGVAAALVPAGGPVPPPSTTPCFAAPVAGEVAAAGAKLVGSAQVRIGGVLLQHGSIPLRPGRFRLAELVPSGAPSSPPPALSSFLDPLPSIGAAIDALASAWRDAIGALEGADITSREEARAARLMPRYGDPAWTWRR